jgi:hypothetical protein
MENHLATAKEQLETVEDVEEFFEAMEHFFTAHWDIASSEDKAMLLKALDQLQDAAKAYIEKYGIHSH